MNLTNKDENRLVLSDDGKLFRERTVLQEVAVNEDEIFQAMQDGFKINLRDVMVVDGCPVHLRTNGKLQDDIMTVWATIGLDRIRLNTSYVMEEGVLVPTFKARGRENDNDAPVMPLEWMVQKAAPRLKLWMLTYTKHNQADNTRPFHLGESWLIATSQTNRHYRLPLPNVYSDCKICMGDFTKTGGTLAECLHNDLRQFFSSNWNADLAPDMESARKMFRFKPSNEGTETLPVIGNWNNLCGRVSIPELDFMALPRPTGGDE